MKKFTFKQSILLLFVTFFMIAGIAKSDIYMKQKQHSDAVKIMEQKKPAKDVIVETWITPKGSRSDNPQNSTIVLLEEKKIIMINHEDKSYTEMPMDIEKMMSKLDEEDAERMKSLQKMMKVDVDVEITDEQKEINNWNCRKYIVTLNLFMGTFTTEIWATQELDVDKELYAKYRSSMMSMSPGLQNAASEIMKEMKKIKGVDVLTISTQKVMNQTVKSTKELLEFKKDDAPDDLFKVPSGYKKKEFDGRF